MVAAGTQPQPASEWASQIAQALSTLKIDESEVTRISQVAKEFQQYGTTSSDLLQLQAERLVDQMRKSGGDLAKRSRIAVKSEFRDHVEGFKVKALGFTYDRTREVPPTPEEVKEIEEYNEIVLRHNRLMDEFSVTIAELLRRNAKVSFMWKNHVKQFAKSRPPTIQWNLRGSS